MEYWCMLCYSSAVGEVDVAVGVPGGFCREHLDRWMAQHPDQPEQRQRVA